MILVNFERSDLEMRKQLHCFHWGRSFRELSLVERAFVLNQERFLDFIFLEA